MEQELQKLNQRLTDVSGLHAEIDYGVDYDLPGTDTIIVVDDVTGEIIAEGETADGIITELNFKLRRKKIKVMSAYECMTADEQTTAVIASWDKDWQVNANNSDIEGTWADYHDVDLYFKDCTCYGWCIDEWYYMLGIEAFNSLRDRKACFVGHLRYGYDDEDYNAAILEADHSGKSVLNCNGYTIYQPKTY